MTPRLGSGGSPNRIKAHSDNSRHVHAMARQSVSTRVRMENQPAVNPARGASLTAFLKAFVCGSKDLFECVSAFFSERTICPKHRTDLANV